MHGKLLIPLSTSTPRAPGSETLQCYVKCHKNIKIPFLEGLRKELKYFTTAMAHSISGARSSREGQRKPERSRCMLLAMGAPKKHELLHASFPNHSTIITIGKIV